MTRATGSWGILRRKKIKMTGNAKRSKGRLWRRCLLRTVAGLIALTAVLWLAACGKRAEPRKGDDPTLTPGADATVTPDAGITGVPTDGATPTPTPDATVYLYEQVAVTEVAGYTLRTTSHFLEDGRLGEKIEERKAANSSAWEMTSKTMLTALSDVDDTLSLYTAMYSGGVVTTELADTELPGGDRKQDMLVYSETGDLLYGYHKRYDAKGTLHSMVTSQAAGNGRFTEKTVAYRDDPTAIPYVDETAEADGGTVERRCPDTQYIAATSVQPELGLITVTVTPGGTGGAGRTVKTVLSLRGNEWEATRLTAANDAEITADGAVVRYRITTADGEEELTLYYEDATEQKLAGAAFAGESWKVPVTEVREQKTDADGSTRVEKRSPVTGAWYTAWERLLDSEGRVVSEIERDENGALLSKVLCSYVTEGGKLTAIRRTLVITAEESEQWNVVKTVSDIETGLTETEEEWIENGDTRATRAIREFRYDSNRQLLQTVVRDSDGTEVVTDYKNEYRKKTTRD